jgi:hypothetical protein
MLRVPPQVLASGDSTDTLTTKNTDYFVVLNIIGKRRYHPRHGALITMPSWSGPNSVAKCQFLHGDSQPVTWTPLDGARNQAFLVRSVCGANAG